MFDVKAADGRPEWKKVVDAVHTQHGSPPRVNAVITYAELTAILGRDFCKARAPIYDAERRLLTDDRRMLVNVRGVGYRIAEAREHITAANANQRRAKRQIRKGVAKLQHTDRSALTHDERTVNDYALTTLSRQQDMLTRLKTRADMVEKALKQERRERSSSDAMLQEQVDELRTALAKRGFLDEREPIKS